MFAIAVSIPSFWIPKVYLTALADLVRRNGFALVHYINYRDIAQVESMNEINCFFYDDSVLEIEHDLCINNTKVYIQVK